MYYCNCPSRGQQTLWALFVLLMFLGAFFPGLIGTALIANLVDSGGAHGGWLTGFVLVWVAATVATFGWQLTADPCRCEG